MILFSPFQGQTKPLCLAHRAEHSKNAENSLEGMGEAIALGADGVELDLRHTSDGIALGLHDFVLWRVANSKAGRVCPKWKPISSLSFAAIRENCELKNSQKIPSLKEIFQLAQDSKIFVLLQFKDDPSPETLQLIKSYPLVDKLRIHSHWDSTLDRFEEFSRQSHLNVKTLKISKYWPRFSSTRGNDIWWPLKWLLSSKSELRNRETGLFLVDTSEQLATAVQLNVDYITTDAPQLCEELK